MLEQLITSRTRSKILGLYLSNPDLEIHLREIARKIEENINSTRRELNHLEKFSILISRKDGNQRYFKINKAHIIYPDLKNIYLKTAGIGNVIRNSLGELGQIHFCFIYGSYARHSEKPESDLDIFIIGEIDENILIPVINSLEKKLSRDINYILYTLEEFQNRKERNDKFVMNVLEGERIMLYGDENEL
ncbi:MAG: nucleotidyltransferase domain-containing protein [Thermoplasmata archaeon]|nr:nucleotidyltransferase domain-containing protein [Thermoplasmata archaeon]